MHTMFVAGFVQHRRSVDILTQSGANPKIKNSSGHTAVPFAIRCTGTECDFAYNKVAEIENSGRDTEADNDWFCDSKSKSNESGET